MNLNLLKSKLGAHYGSERFYHQWNKKSVYTVGAKEFFELAEAWWLYDIIQTEVHLLLMNKNQLDTFQLQITSIDHVGRVQLVDYVGKELWQKHIPWTSFPEGEYTLVVGWDGQRTTTCLISEN